MVAHAMLFAAGLGTRMRPLTDHLPKALIEVAGRPLLDHVLRHFEAAGCTRIVVNAHHHAEQIERYLANRRSPAELLVSHESTLLETGGAVLHALHWLGAEPFFTANTDAIWCDADQPSLTRLAASFDPVCMDALLLLHPRERVSGGQGTADFGLNEQRELTRGAERPYAYTGVQVLHPRLLRGRSLATFSLRDAWFQAARGDGSLARMCGLVHDGEWMPVGTPNELVAAERFLCRERPTAAG